MIATVGKPCKLSVKKRRKRGGIESKRRHNRRRRHMPRLHGRLLCDVPRSKWHMNREIGPSNMEPEEEWVATADGGFKLAYRRPPSPTHDRTQNVYTGWSFDSTKGFPGEGPGSARKRHRTAKQIQPASSGTTRLQLLTWNMNGVHVVRRRGTGIPDEDSDDEPLGDGFDLRADATAKLSTAMRVMCDKGYAATIWQETHADRKEQTAIIGMLKRCHGLEAYGTPGRYTEMSSSRRGGVLVIWDPRKLMCEEREIVQCSRIVRVKLRSMQDGSAFNLVGAYMPNRTDTKDVVDESWELLSAHATTDSLIGGDMNVDTQLDGTAAAQWMADTIEDCDLRRFGGEAHTYENERIDEVSNRPLASGERTDGPSTGWRLRSQIE